MQSRVLIFIIVFLSSITYATAESQDKELLFGVMGACSVSPTFERLENGTDSSFSDGTSLYPELTALRIFPDAKFNVDLQAAAEAQTGKAQILQQPKNGKVYLKDGYNLKYLPNKNYVGKDKIVYLVNIDGHKIKVVDFIRVVDFDVKIGENYQRTNKKYCPKSDWRIPSLTHHSSGTPNGAP